MTHTHLSAFDVLLYLAAFVLFIVLVLLLNGRLERQRRFESRIAALHRAPDRTDPASFAITGAEPHDGPNLLNMVSGVGELVMRSGLLSRQSVESLQETLRVSGFRNRHALGLLIGAKLLLLLAAPLLVWLTLRIAGANASLQFYLPILAAVGGLLSPDVIIRLLHRRHLARLEAGIADALDMLVICSQAGLGLEPALERVGREISFAHPAVAQELAQTSQDMRVNADRRLALTNLGKRTGLESLRRLSATLVQTMQYGTPLSDALRGLAAEHRQETLNRFETKAGRLSVMLTLPMIAFILPCLFMVVGGPAIVQVLHAYHH
jgi:tight adherence protein C